MSYNFTLKLVAGTANIELAKDISRLMNVPLSHAIVSRFVDGEITVQVEDSVRGSDVFVIQPHGWPVNDNIMELLLIVDALKRASAARITTVIPYYAYARQDRKAKPRVPIAAALLARYLESAGVDHVITLDLHAGQIQGFFHIPVDNVAGNKIIMGKTLKKLFGYIDNMVIVSPDAAGGERAERFRTYLKNEEGIEADFAIMNKWKQREEQEVVPTGTIVKIAPKTKEFKMELMGNVAGRVCVIVDDLAETGSTILHAAKCLRDAGAATVIACVTHCLLDLEALDRIREDPYLDHLIVTDTVPSRDTTLTNQKELKGMTKSPSSQAFGDVEIDGLGLDLTKGKKYPKIMRVSIANILAESIRRVHNEESISITYF